jgi:hypothetical protein
LRASKPDRRKGDTKEAKGTARAVGDKDSKGDRRLRVLNGRGLAGQLIMSMTKN